MREKNKIVANRMVFQKNSNTSCGHEIRNKFKKRLNNIDYNESSHLINALSLKNIVRKKIITNYVPMPSLTELQKQIPISSPKKCSQIFFGKVFDIKKSTFSIAKEKKEDSYSRECSPRSIKQCLQEKIMENVKRHKKKDRLPKIGKQVTVQKGGQKSQTEQAEKHEEKFVIWQKRQKGQYMRVSVNTPSVGMITNRPNKLSRQKEKQLQLSFKRRENYVEFRDFTPWAERQRKQGQLTQ